MNNFLFVHQCSRQQYIITGLIESHEEAKSSCLSSVSGPVARFLSLEREKIEGKKRAKDRKKKLGDLILQTARQTSVAWAKEAAAVHSRRGRDVSEW